METPEQKLSPTTIPAKPLPGATPTNDKKPAGSLPILGYFFGTVLVSAALRNWQWIASGIPLLLSTVLVGEWHGSRVASWLPLWVIFTGVNLIYLIIVHSWLLFCVFAAFCYTTILISSLVQFEWVARVARRQARRLIHYAYFVQDTVGLFDLPALEIDTDSLGLLVMRGMTFSLSTLTGTVYGVEVGVKLDDMELAIQTDKVVVKLFRRIEVGDVYANVKGGDEMCFRDIPKYPNKRDMSKDEFIARGTPILKAAMAKPVAALSDTSSDSSPDHSPTNSPTTSSSTSTPPELEVKKAPIRKLSPTDKELQAEYDETIKHIINTSTSSIARNALTKKATDQEIHDLLDNELNMRAAVSAHIHNQATISHPPDWSVRVSTLQHNKHPKFKRFLHRLPFLYRLLLNPLSYFHPVFIKSITSTGSGQWFEDLMKQHFFKHYADSGSEVGRLQTRISAWLADANYAVGLSDMYCNAYVPMDTAYDLEFKFKIADLKAHRVLPDVEALTQVIHLGGADATLTLPSFLLPHHEHIAPAKLTDFEEMQLQQEIEEAKGTPKAVQMERDLKMRQRDETAMRISAHGHLPAIFDQQLLNFAAATVKATKVIADEQQQEELVLKRAETEKAESLRRERANTTATTASEAALNEAVAAGVAAAENSISAGASGPASIRSTDSDKDTMDSVPASTISQKHNAFAARMSQTFKGMNTKVVDGWRKAGINTVNAMANDRWIAMLIGKIMRKLEKAQGDVGYSGVIALSLEEWRAKAEDGTKILP